MRCLRVSVFAVMLGMCCSGLCIEVGKAKAPEASTADWRSSINRQWQVGRPGWDPTKAYVATRSGARRLSHNDVLIKGRDGEIYCRRSDGSTGVVAGALDRARLTKAGGAQTLGSIFSTGGKVSYGDVRCR